MYYIINICKKLITKIIVKNDYFPNKNKSINLYK